MFKANLIEDPDYYRLKRTLLIVGIPSSLVLGMFSIFDNVSFLPILLYLLAVLVFMLFQYRLGKGISIIAKNRKIEISPERITIKSKSGEIEEQIDLEKVDKIIVKDSYSIPEEDWRALYREMKGDTDRLKNFLIIEQENQPKRFEFIIDSYYMIEQMKKLIKHWQNKGHRVEVAGE